MKTVKLEKPDTPVEIMRVSDELAAAMTKRGWKYCSKTEWKALRPKLSEEKSAA